MTTTIVYRCPGKHLLTNGVTFDTLGILIEDLAKHLEDGWHETIPQAIEAFLNEPVPVAEPVPDDNAPPTRDEMLAKAQLLGLRVDKRWSDETLLEKISAALAAAADPI